MKILLSLLLIFASSAYAQTNRQSHYAVTQVGGYVGLLTSGVGYDINHAYQTEAILGYTPWIVGGKDLFSLAWKNSLKFQKFNGFTPYIGINLLYSFDNNTFVEQPSKYPANYYPPTGLRLAPYIGLQYKEDKHAVYFELTSLDHYLETYVRSDNQLQLHEITTYGFGYRFDLGS
jgi:hypothetical protein